MTVVVREKIRRTMKRRVRNYGKAKNKNQIKGI
jgi:hypothetical protein